MAERPGIIFLSPYLPAHDTSGGSKVIFDSLRCLRAAGYGVHLFSFCSDDDTGRVPEVGKYCDGVFLENLKNYSRYPAGRGVFSDKITSLGRMYRKLLLQCEYGFMARYLPGGRGIIPLVLREHEVLSKSFYERAQCESNPFRKAVMLARMVKKSREESRWYRRFDRIIVFSDHDRDYVAARNKIKNVSSVPLGIDVQGMEVLPPAAERGTIIFVGNFSHAPNADAALYFCHRIMPLIRKEMPDTRVSLVGAFPPPEVTRLARLKGVTVTGYVSQVDSYYAASTLAVVPVRFGAGMRFKIIEAMAKGRPVVSTSVGARGIASDGALSIADTAEDFASAVIRLLRDQGYAGALASRGRAAVEKYYARDAVFARYEDMYRELLQ